MRCAVALLTLALLAGCPKGEPAASPADEQGQPPARTSDDVPLPRVHKDNQGLLFTYVGEQGRVVATADLEEIPASVKSRVLVTDLALAPEERQAHRVAFFADLSAPGLDGSYPVTAVSRFDAARGEGLRATLPPAPAGSVFVYSAEWCGFCQKAKAWLSAENVPFVERDVEKQVGAAKELREKLLRASIQGGGVPVIDWEGTLVMGFDKRRLQVLLENRRKQEGGAEEAP
jgi:glutaredoxin